MELKSRESDGTAKFSDSHYCRRTKNLLTILGLWPDQDPLEQTLRTAFILASLTFSVLTQMLKLRSCYKDFEAMVEIIAPMTTILSNIAKVLTFYRNRDKLKSLLHEMDMNWRCLRDNREIEIMNNSMSIGKFHTTIYLIYICVAATLFLSLVFVPTFLDVVAPLNESRSLNHAYPSDYYFLNEENHFPIILCHEIFIVCIAMAVMIAVDSMYIMYVRCCCSLFKIVGHRFEYSLYEDVGIQGFPGKINWMKCNQRMAIAVPAHNEALMHLQKLESVFSLPSMFQVGITVICLTFALMQTVLLLGRVEMLRFTFLAGGSLIHLFCYYYQGQLVLDETEETAYQIYSGPWYNEPTELQKALLYVLRRFAVLSQLTGGKIIVLSKENYSTMVKNCMSYFTMLASFR